MTEGHEHLESGDVVSFAESRSLVGLVTVVEEKAVSIEGRVRKTYSGRWNSGVAFEGLSRGELIFVLRPRELYGQVDRKLIEDATAFRRHVAAACGDAAIDMADAIIPKGSRLAVLVLVQDDDGTSIRASANVRDPQAILKNVLSGSMVSKRRT